MICHIAEKLFGGLKIVHRGGAEGAERVINLVRPWRRVKMVNLVEERTGWRFDKRKLSELPTEVSDKILALYQDGVYRSHLTQLQRNSPADAVENPEYRRVAEDMAKRSTAAFKEHLWRLTAAEQLQEVYEKLIESWLIDPCYVTHVPSVIIPLARKNADDPFFADVYELAINGVEISPGYSELNDPDIQAANFGHQVGDEAEKQKMDEDFLNALRYGMPPAGGIGLGIDRLIMMLTGAESIRDVILFPLMRPQA
jgi:lysyl-tRNA synthetase class 2